MRQGPNHRRSRNRNGRRQHPQQQRQQTFDSTGPDIRIRGNAYQVLEKYLAMARDATAAGDRIAAENYYQHAEHYHRIVSANGGEQGAGGRPRPDQPQGPYQNGTEGQAAAPAGGDGGTEVRRPENGASVDDGADDDSNDEPGGGNA